MGRMSFGDPYDLGVNEADGAFVAGNRRAPSCCLGRRETFRMCADAWRPA